MKQVLLLILFISTGCTDVKVPPICRGENTSIEEMNIPSVHLTAEDDRQKYITVRVRKNGFTLITRIKGEVISRDWESY